VVGALEPIQSLQSTWPSPYEAILCPFIDLLNRVAGNAAPRMFHAKAEWVDAFGIEGIAGGAQSRLRDRNEPNTPRRSSHSGVATTSQCWDPSVRGAAWRSSRTARPTLQDFLRYSVLTKPCDTSFQHRLNYQFYSNYSQCLILAIRRSFLPPNSQSNEYWHSHNHA
jgi:hypothetical protein